MRFQTVLMPMVAFAVAAFSGCSDADSAAKAQVKNSPAKAPTTAAEPAQPNRDRLVSMIADALAALDEIKDYRYTLKKQERVDDVLLDPQVLINKIRHEPFSVYLKFLEPEDKAGTEAIYVEGKNDDKLIGHATGIKALLGTQVLDPKGMLAMLGNRYPITNSGMKNTLLKLQRMADDPAFAGCRIEVLEDEKIDDRPCVGVQISNPKRRSEFKLARAKLLFDRETKLLAHFSSMHWLPENPREPELVEEYTYSEVKLHCGFSDVDFDPKNPEYKYP